MNVTEALDQIEEIHAHLAKGEIYRGYRPVPVALSGLLGIGAAWVQPQVVHGPDAGFRFLTFWVAAAGVNLVLNLAAIAWGYFRQRDLFARRHTGQVVGQFMPCVAAGAAVTTGVVLGGFHLVKYLPGMWQVLFGLGLFASRPYLPRATGWVALFYVLAGAAVLGLHLDDLTQLGHVTGAVFGVGQLAAAAVLHANLPRAEGVRS